MLLIAVISALTLSVADAMEPAASPPPQVRHAGETMSYSLHAVMSQSITGLDAFGRHINQTAAPTTLKLHESIAITKATDQDLGMHRLGNITAAVVGAKPVKKDGQGWTTLDSRGLIVRDRGKLGGLFLLPLPFLADSGMKNGDELTVGDAWNAQLGTKLYGMTARPHMKYTVIAERLISGSKVYSIDAVGTVPMKEPIMTASGEPLGYATGTAEISAHMEYDRVNRRLISMHAQLSDTLHYSGTAKHGGGHVKDRQQCELSLDQEPLAGASAPSDDPSSGPLP